MARDGQAPHVPSAHASPLQHRVLFAQPPWLDEPPTHESPLQVPPVHEPGPQQPAHFVLFIARRTTRRSGARRMSRSMGARATRIVDVPLTAARCQLVVGDVPTLVDAGLARDVPRTLAAIERAGLAPRDVKRIVLTHADGDHAGGAARLQELTGAEVVAHRAEASYLGDGELPRGFGLVKRLVIAMSGGRARPPEIVRWLDGGEQLDELEILHTPGHTAGHVAILVGRVLIAGDAFVSGARCKEVPRVMSDDVPRSRRTLAALAERDVDRAFSGHGAPVDDAGRRLRALAARLRAS